VSVVEAHAGDRIGGPRSFREVLRLAHVQTQWLLREDVLARGEGGRRDRVVQVVGGAVVDDVDGVVGEDVVERAVGALEAETLGRLATPLGGAREDAARGRTRHAPERVEVRRRREAGADDRRSEGSFVARAHRLDASRSPRGG
jgi:hypothetical protein